MLKSKYLLLHPITLSLIMVIVCTFFYKYQNDSLYLLILQLLLLMMVVIAIHEIGHLVAGLIQHAQLHFLTWWFLIAIQVNGKIKIMINENVFLALGTTKMYFKSRKDIKNLKRKLLLNYIGGPLINLVIAVIMLSYRAIEPNTQLTSSDSYSYFLILNLIIGIITLIPVEGTDGGEIVSLMKKSNAEVVDDYTVQYLYYKAIEDIQEDEFLWLEKKVTAASNDDEVFSIAILKAHYHINKKNYNEASTSLIFAQKIVSSEIQQKILGFYNSLIKSLIQKEMSEEYIEQLKEINFWYGKCMYSISLNILKQNSSDYKKICISKNEIYKEMVDPHQQMILLKALNL